jgi:aspartate oxidase
MMGRPTYNPNPRDRKRVEILVCAGWTQDRIALALGIDAKSLRKHCRDELDHGAARCRAEIVAGLLRRAAGGSPVVWKLLRRLGVNPDFHRQGPDQVLRLLPGAKSGELGPRGNRLLREQ